MLTIDRILTPVDFSETATHALKYAVELATLLDAAVKIIHVYHFLSHAIPDDELITPDLSDPKGDYTAGAQRQLDTLVQRYTSPGIEFSSEVVEGVPYTEIIRAAELFDADMIVLGTHGHTGIAHLLLGSVAEQVVRQSPIPVMTVRSPK